ncbi:MAG: hypothetical protein FD167_1312, partial [bacterium]
LGLQKNRTKEQSEFTYKAAEAIAKSVANVFIGMNNLMVPVLGTQKDLIEPYQPSDASQELIMHVTDAALIALPLAGRGSLTGVGVAVSEGESTTVTTGKLAAIADAVKSAETTTSGGSLGGMRSLQYETNPKHTSATRSGAHGQEISPAPINGQAALDASFQIKPTSPRRVGIDFKNKEIVVFDRDRVSIGGSHPDIYHGHVRPFNKLEPGAQNLLKKLDLVDKKGKIQ